VRQYPPAAGAPAALCATSELAALPAAAGTYVLVGSLQRGRRLRIGRLGLLWFPGGRYAYCGSAFGPGGLRARLRQHLAAGRRRHWHLDYLRPCLVLTGAWYCTAPRRLEHAWARRLQRAVALAVPVPGFGASDCRCPAHLFRLDAELNFSGVAGILAGEPAGP